MGHRRRGLRRRPGAARPTRDPRPGLRAGHRLRPPRRHPRRADAPRPDRPHTARALLAALLGRGRGEGPAHLRLGVHHAHRRRGVRTPLVADPPPPAEHRGAGLLPLLQPAPGAAARAGPRRRLPLDHRGDLPGRQGPDRAGRTPACARSPASLGCVEVWPCVWNQSRIRRRPSTPCSAGSTRGGRRVDLQQERRCARLETAADEVHAVGVRRGAPGTGEANFRVGWSSGRAGAGRSPSARPSGWAG